MTDGKDLLNFLAIALLGYLVCRWAMNTEEGMFNMGAPMWSTPQYAYPATYPAYYKHYQLDVTPTANKCMVTKELDKTECINRQLFETGGDLNTSIATCNGTKPYDAYLQQPQYRKLMTAYPESLHLMPLTVPTVSQEVPSYESWAERRY